jgi:hypothetical protein
LEKVPDAERVAWRKLGDNVAAMLTEAAQAK